MSKTYLDLLSTSRVRAKSVAYFARYTEPISTRKLAAEIREDVGAVSHLIREYRQRGFIQKRGVGYVLSNNTIRKELCALAEPVARLNPTRKAPHE